jgi:hypothetical protein
MNDVPESVQVRMEQTAILNARALVEKLEKERRQGLSGKVVLIATAAVASVFVGVGIYGAATSPNAGIVANRPAVASVDVTPAKYMDHALERIDAEGNRPDVATWLESIPGPGVLKVVIQPSGYSNVSVETSTGDASADSRLMTIVSRAEPFGLRAGKTVFHLKVSVLPSEKRPRFRADLDRIVLP